MAHHQLKKSLSAQALINTVYKEFSKIPNPRQIGEKTRIPLTDHLMAGLAIFGLKFPSLLQYDRKRKNPPIEKNLKNLYLVQSPPSDTYLRECLDEVDPMSLRPAFKKLFALLQRGKHLEKFEFFEGQYLLSIDGTGEFSSGKIGCKQCCVKQHRGGKVTYYHQMLGGCIVHPDQSNVIPLCPEMIQKVDGDKKNDCERNSAKRFIKHFRREHPHLKVIVVEDALGSNGPHLTLLETNNMKYIIGAKPSDHVYLFEQAEKSDKTQYHEIYDDKDTLHQFSFTSDLPLNKKYPNLKVSLIEYRETRKNGKELNFSWVTNIPVTKENIYCLMRGGRARWKIENETFNTLKNLGYHFEHNFGHGKEYLASVFCLLMVLSFLIDQIQEISCSLYRSMKDFAGTYRALWEQMRTLFQYVTAESWEEFYQLTANKRRFVAYDTS